MENGQRLIAVDCDGVIADWVGAFTRYANDVLGVKMNPKDFKSYDFWHQYGWSDSKAIDIFKEFQGTEFFRRIEPVRGSVEGVEALRKHGELVVITARQPHMEPATRAWIDRHFPKKFTSLHLTSGHVGTPRIKSVKCKSIGTKLLIEDSKEFANECASAGIPVVLLNYPWNQGKLNPGVHRVESWDHVPDKARDIIEQL